MKIGIFTFQRAYNYGAFLQSLALKSFLEKMGHSVKFLDYQSLAHTRSYDLINWDMFHSLGLRGKTSLIIRGILKYPRQLRRYSKMKKLQTIHLGLTGKPKSSLETLNSTNLDLIIYGSDQIWRKSAVNPNSGFDPAYWGEGFDNVRKITYAASMGIIDLSDRDKQFIREHLQLYSSISVREEKLLDELTPLSDQKICHVLDPVFLLDKKDWEQLIAKKGIPANRQKYVLVYNLMHSNEVDHLAKRIARERGLEVIEITGSIQPYIFDKNILQTQDAFEFLNYIRNAEFVVASSFHAIAFSIMFNVNFYAVGLNKNSERVRSLLELANLQDRLIIDNEIQRIKSIDFSKTNLYNAIEVSKNYLYSSI